MSLCHVVRMAVVRAYKGDWSQESPVLYAVFSMVHTCLGQGISAAESCGVNSDFNLPRIAGDVYWERRATHSGVRHIHLGHFQG